jgi:hypothetical protein
MITYLILAFVLILIGILGASNGMMYASNEAVEGFSTSNKPLGKNISFDKGDALLENDYPLTGRNGVSNNSAATIWWHYPIFEVGSYKQITNNIRYPNNPDDGQCMPAEFCGALYKEKPHMPSNYAQVLGPVPNSPNARVNYYNTDDNLLPFKNEGNILY